MRADGAWTLLGGHGELIAIDPVLGLPSRVIRAPDGHVAAQASGVDGLWVGFTDGRVLCFEPGSGAQVVALPQRASAVEGVWIPRDGEVAVAYADASLRVFGARDGRLLWGALTFGGDAVATFGPDEALESTAGGVERSLFVSDGVHGLDFATWQRGADVGWWVRRGQDGAPSAATDLDAAAGR